MTSNVKRRAPARDKGYRKYTIKLRKILHNGLFISYPLETHVEVDNEPQVLLWRAVLDQHLKDIISHHMLERNYYQYYNARVFFDEQLDLTSGGQECILAFLDPEKVLGIVQRLEKLCRELRDKGITLWVERRS